MLNMKYVAFLETSRRLVSRLRCKCNLYLVRHVLFSTDLITEAFFCRELGAVSDHILAGEDSVSHKLDQRCHVRRHGQLKGHLTLSHWKRKQF